MITGRQERVRVLYVDDDPALRDLIATHLERENERFEIVTAADAGQGLARVESGRIDCVVSGHELPGMDGLAFLEAVRRAHGDLPFLLYTARGSEDFARRALSAGASDYVRKRPGAEPYALLANRIERSVGKARAERRLTASDANLRQLLAETPASVCIISEGTFDHVNESAVATLGRRDVDDLLGRDALAFVHPDDREAVGDALDRATGGRPEGTARLGWRVADGDGDGTARHLEGKVSPVEWDGEPAVLVIARDVTGQVEHRRELRKNERKYAQILDHLESVVWLSDASFDEVLYVNAAYEERYGLTIEDLMDDAWAYLGAIHPDDREAEIRSSNAIYEAINDEDREVEDVYVDEFRLLQDGEVSWIREFTFPIRDEDGEVFRWAGIEHDVTRQREREHELREARRRYEQILEHLESAVYLTDAAFEEVLYVNGAYEDIWKRPVEGLYEDSMDYQRAVHPDDLAAEDEQVERIYRTANGNGGELQDSYADEYRIVHPDGEERWIDELVFPVLDGEEEIIRWAGVAQDVTDQKRREEKLERLNDRLRKVTSIVTHDVRNPLGIATGRLDLFRETGEETHLETVAEALERIETILADSVTLAKQSRVRRSPTTMSVAGTARRVWNRIPEPDATLAVEADRSVRAEEDQFESLFRNLFRNATTHGGADVTVRVTGRPDGFVVEDTGTGVPADVRDQVFEQGFTTSDGGSGYGLFIVSQVAADHGWTVELEESDEGGARFVFTVDGDAGDGGAD